MLTVALSVFGDRERGLEVGWPAKASRKVLVLEMGRTGQVELCLATA